MEIEIGGRIDIPVEFDDIAKRYFMHYIFYQTYRKGDSLDDLDYLYGGVKKPFRRGWCTNCGQWTESDASCSGDARELWKCSHNGTGHCPNCGERVQYKSIGRSGMCKNLTDKPARLLFVQIITPERVILRACNVWRDMRPDDPERLSYEYDETARYDLRPGSAELWKKPVSGWYYYLAPASWEKKKKIGEPWPMTVSCGTPVDYRLALSADGDDLNGTFLQYLPLEDFASREWLHGGPYGGRFHTNRVPWGMILSYAAMYPSVEMAAKRGWWDLLEDLCGFGKPNARYINWAGTKPEAFFRRAKNRQDAKIIAGCRRHVDALQFYAGGQTAAQAAALADRWEYDDLKRCANMLLENPMELDYYLEKQGRHGHDGAIFLQDYREAAGKLGRDLSVPLIRWPKNLVGAHDEAVKSVKMMSVEKKNGIYRDTVYPMYRRRYEFEADGWCAIVPERLEDIALEGRLQHHCVGGYIDRHAEGQTIIIFLRPSLCRAVPRYTVEITPGGQLKQVQGYNNRLENKPTEDALAFMEKWYAEIARRLAKEKRENKKAAEAAKEEKERATA